MPSTVLGSVSWTKPFFTRPFFCFLLIHAENPHPQVALRGLAEIPQSPIAEFDRVLQVNVKGMYLAIRAETAAVKTQEPGAVSSSKPQRGEARGVSDT